MITNGPGIAERRRNAALAGAFVIAVHLILIALLWPQPILLTDLPEGLPVIVDIVPPKPPPDEKLPDNKAALAQPAPLPAPVAPTIPVPDSASLLTASQLAGATEAGEGNGGGGTCDMARRIQDALRRDPLVRAAVEKAGRLGQAILVWNGDWVQSGVEDGKGLSTIREAIMWEVGFSPPACRSQQMHGLVLLSLSDKATRFGLGTDTWRWSDLLGLR